MPWWTSVVGPSASLWHKAYRWWCQPVLRIEFHESRTYDVVRLPEYNGALGRFCHFFVYNDGRATARHARARLMSVARLTEFGEPRPEPNFVAPRTLKWADETDFDPRDIERGVPRRADLCYAAEGYNVMHFVAVPVGVGVQTTFPPGRYHVGVRVDTDDALPAEAEFDVDYKGDWATITIRPRAAEKGPKQ